MRLLLVPVALLLLLALLAPAATAHTSPAILDVEEQVLLDEADDAYYVTDGYDLFDLYVREAYWSAFDQEGLVFRIGLYGGFGPAGGAGPAAVSHLHIDLELAAGGDEHTYRFTTPDDAQWSGDAPVLHHEVEPDLGGVSGQLLVFVPYAELGVAPGDTVSDIRLASYADERVVDEAPGGMNPVGGPQAPVGDSVRFIEEYPLRGPVGYTWTDASVADADVHFDVGNNITTSDQHLFLEPGDGWQVEPVTPWAAEVEAEEDVRFTLRVLEAGDDPLRVDVVTDTGGRETLYLAQAGDGFDVARGEPPAVQDDGAPAQESPGLLAGAAVAALVLVALVRRRG